MPPQSPPQGLPEDEQVSSMRSLSSAKGPQNDLRELSEIAVACLELGFP